MKIFIPNDFQEKVCPACDKKIHPRHARCKDCGSDYEVVMVMNRSFKGMSARQAMMKVNTPKDLKKATNKVYREMKAEARRLSRETGIPHEVDHIHPIKGRNFCGLHVPWNLQIITASENRRKHNNLPEDL